MGKTAFERLNGPVLASLLAGASVADAATKHGIAPRTIERWIAKGRDDADSKYAAFAAAVDAQREARDVPAGAMTAAEFRVAIDGAVRSGSIPAMRLWSELFLDGAGEDSGEPPSKIASLAERRRQKGAAK